MTQYDELVQAARALRLEYMHSAQKVSEKAAELRAAAEEVRRELSHGTS